MTATLHIPSLTLRVRDLNRSREFYVRQLGFVAINQTSERVELAGEPDAAPLLTLIAGASGPAPSQEAGLFHAALLLPDREALGKWLTMTAANSVEFEGFSDHGVSEAIYLSDPDGNGLEVYVDRPRSEWPYVDGELAMSTRPLAIRSLLANGKSDSTPLGGARWGHLHLRVTNLERSEAFYRSTLGLETTQRSYPGARFLAADGYHHHVGLNTWGNPRLPASDGAAGLAEVVFARAGLTAEKQHTDPDGVAIRLLPWVSLSSRALAVKG
jgi:catechol 2,3-dioxygenase